MFASELYDVVPDILCLAKAFGGGVMPAGAVVANEKTFKNLFDNPFLHTTTLDSSFEPMPPFTCSSSFSFISAIFLSSLSFLHLIIRRRNDNGYK